MPTMALTSETENVWMDKWRYEDAEVHYQMNKLCYAPSATKTQGEQKTSSSLVSEIAKARHNIQMSLKGESVDNALASRLEAVELDNQDLRKVTEDLQAVVKKLECRIAALEAGSSTTSQKEKVETKAKEESDEDDDDLDLFGSDEEDDEENERLKEERVKAYQARKSNKPKLIAKSNVILDVKPWDDETDMAKLEECVRSIEMDGLLWGKSKLAEVGYGIKKLVITTVIEDDKVSMEDVEDKICAFEDYIQSMDIAAFNKI